MEFHKILKKYQTSDKNKSQSIIIYFIFTIKFPQKKEKTVPILNLIFIDINWIGVYPIYLYIHFNLIALKTDCIVWTSSKINLRLKMLKPNIHFACLAFRNLQRNLWKLIRWLRLTIEHKSNLLSFYLKFILKYNSDSLNLRQIICLLLII